jgi:outer membrane lipoprotein-sorting protein
MSDANSRPTPDPLDRATGALRDAPIPPGPPAELTAVTAAAMKNRLAGAVPASELARKQRRRMMMRYIGFGSVTAATVAVVTTAALFWFGGNQAVALDKVLEKVKQAESATFVETQTVGDQAPMIMEYSLRGSLVRIDAAGGSTVLILDTAQKTGLMLIPQLRAYVKIDQNSPNKIHGPVGGKSPLDDIISLKDRKAESVVEEKLNGKTVQKLTIKADPKANPPGDWVLWIDPKTELPVKILYTGTTVAGDRTVPVSKVYEKFVWNPKLDAKLFDVKVPDGYKEGFPGEQKPKK